MRPDMLESLSKLYRRGL